LSEKGMELQKIDWTKHGYFVKKSPFSLGSTPEYLLGYYFLQDPASMYACEVLQPKKGEVILDMAAAPGGKTTYLAQLMENKGTIVALELNKQRMKSLRSNITRMGIENVITIRMNALDTEDLGIKFDKVLLDAPCTGTGTVFKNPDAAYKKKRDVERCTALQKSLLEIALKVLKKRGILVYSTCSILPEENEFIVSKFKSVKIQKIKHGNEGFSNVYGKNLGKDMKKTRRFYPHIHKTQGFFIAKLKY
jgi:NOL1/NOP2/sun family putative RNA methylase